MLRAMVAPSFPRLADRVLLALLLPMVGPLIERQYGATREAGARVESEIVEGFARVSALLVERRYLAGERFGAADLTFAALGGALVLPRENRWMKHDVALPPHMRAFIDRLRATRAGEHTARCYREHRSESANH
jgi:glutathione S-transferase